MIIQPFETCELRLVQERNATSAADALTLLLGYPGPLEGKLWTILGLGYQPSVNESRIITMEKVTRTNNVVALMNPITLDLNPRYATCMDSIPEITLLPFEHIRIRRSVAAAGSTMVGYIQLIESDLPLYSYTEPQEALRQKQAGSMLRKMVSRGGGGPGGGGVGGIRGGRGVPPAR